MEIDKEELKNETKETVNQVRDTLKNVNINQEAKETKGFLKGMLVEPFDTVERVATGEQEAFKRALVLLIVHCALAFVSSILGYHYGNILNKLKNIVLDTIAPILMILVPTIMIIIMNKNSKKSAPTIISTLVVARVPAIVSAVISVIWSIVPKISLIASPISSVLSVITMVLTFHGMRTLFDEESQSFLGKFAIIEFVTYLVSYIF